MADEGTITEIASRRAKEQAEAEAAELNGGSGRSIEELAESGEGVEDEEGQQLLDFGDQLNLSLKGKKPSESKLKIRAIQRDIRGQLGDRGDDEDYAFLIVGRLSDISVPIRRDEAHRAVSKKRVHTLDPVDVIPVPRELVEEFLQRATG